MGALRVDSIFPKLGALTKSSRCAAAVMAVKNELKLTGNSGEFRTPTRGRNFDENQHAFTGTRRLNHSGRRADFVSLSGPGK